MEKVRNILRLMILLGIWLISVTRILFKSKS